VFDLLIPCGFVLYTHYSNFKDDEQCLKLEYQNNFEANIHKTTETEGSEDYTVIEIIEHSADTNYN
jgi:hypothetical protein